MRNTTAEQEVQRPGSTRDPRFFAAARRQLSTGKRASLSSQLLSQPAMTLQTQRVDHRRLREAVDLHTSGLPDESREETRSELLRHSRSGTTSFDHSRIVLSDSKVVACLLVERQRDSTWHFHLPVFAKCLESDTVQQLKQSLCAGLCEDFNQSDAWIAQTLISPDQSDDAIVLGETGFPVLTDLLFMGRPCHREIPDQTGSKTWPFETWSDTSEDLFAAIMESTYEGTRDCPELNGFRTGRHALRSHSLSGCFDPQLWRPIFRWLQRCRNRADQPSFGRPRIALPVSLGNCLYRSCQSLSESGTRSTDAR